jgi:hypothetical protein
MEAHELQQHFFNHLKSVLPAHISLVDELADLLDLSYDSVYRRIRGEKPISLQELRNICAHYHVSMDQVLQLQNDTVVFQAPDINQPALPFIDYLRGMLAHVKYFNSFKDKKVMYLCKDMTFFHFYLFPEIAAFKTFFWSKTIQNAPHLKQKAFTLSEFSFDDCYAIGQDIIREYNEVPSVELWNFESINSSISQIQYYRDAGVFSNKQDFERVVISLEKTLDHLELQAEKGVKFLPGNSDAGHRASLEFYVNEVVLGSNTILVELNGSRTTYVTHSVLSYLIGKDVRFNEKAFSSFQNILSRSALISVTGERERNKFFRSLKDRVHRLME